eukprot:scpid9666/ scgid6106/ Transmembrane and TPR repeat-containing protein 1
MVKCHVSYLSWLESPLIGEAVVLLLAASCYMNSLRGDFVHDDIFAIKENHDLRPETPLRQLFVDDFWGTQMSSPKSHKSYRPLCVLTFRLNYLVSGLTPYHYHLCNVVLHAVASNLFMIVAHEVVFRSRTLAVLAALLFAAHPVHAEAVTGVVGRADVLACILSLLGFLMYHRCIKSGGSTNWPLLFGSIACAAAGMLCKEQGITVLGICLVYDWLVNTDILEKRQLSLNAILSDKQRVLRSGIVLSSIISLLAFRMYMLNGQLPGFTDQDNPASFAAQWSTRFFTFAYLWAFNANLLTTPVTLSYDWQMGSIPLVESLADARQIATLATFGSLAALSFVALLHSRAVVRRILLVSLCFLVLPFLPASNLFFRVGFVVAERILYLPSIGFSLLVVFGLNELTAARSLSGTPDSSPGTGAKPTRPEVQRRSAPAWPAVLFVVLVAAMAGKTVVRNPVWWTRESLFRSGLAVVPDNAKVHYNYANFLKDSSRADEAIVHYRRALSLYPNHASASNNLGTIVSDNAESERLYKRATELNPHHSRAFFNLGGLLRDQNRLEEAKAAFEKALKIDEKYADALSGLSGVLEAQGNVDLALSMLQHAISLHPEQADYHHNLAVFYSNQGHLQESLDSYAKALQLNPDRHITLISYARQLRKAKHNDAAEAAFKKLVRVIQSGPHIMYLYEGSTCRGT